MKTVMVHAYTKFNLGDDLFIKVLCERYPETKFILFAPREYRILFKDLDNIQIYATDTLLMRGINFFFRKLKTKNWIREIIESRCHAAIYIGGSLFMQGKNWRDELIKVNNMRINNKPFYLLGANFGPFEDQEFFQSYLELFKKYTDICFREKYSYDLFSDLSNVRLADDIIFQISPQVLEENNENNVVISVIKPSKKQIDNFDEDYYEKMKDISIRFVERGQSVTLMSFCEREGDIDAIDKIMERIPSIYKKDIQKYSYKLNLNEALGIIERSSFVIASRFHAMILGWVFKKPVLPIVYSKKMLNVMDDVGFTGLYSEINTIESLDLDAVYNCSDINVIDVSKQAKDAEMHFSMLDKYLNK